jgi:hypothetical protein
MSLVVDRIACVEESDEVGSDDIYLIVFQGRTVAPFASGLNVVGPGNFWDDFDSTEKENTVHRIASTNSDAVYAVMMVEKDNSKDIAGEIVGTWQAVTAGTWKGTLLTAIAGGMSPGSVAAKNEGFAEIKKSLNSLASLYMAPIPFFGDDDVIGVQRVTITKPGQKETLRFRSNAEDATYDVTFRHTTDA